MTQEVVERTPPARWAVRGKERLEGGGLTA
jgi:hypothetical protein